MNKKSSIGILFTIIFGLIFLSIVLMDLLFGAGFIWSPGPYKGSLALQHVESKISIGEDRERMISILKEDVWHHAEDINFNNRIDDLFFFGKKNFSEVNLVIVTSKDDNGIMRVDSISEFEYYNIHEYGTLVPYLTLVEGTIKPGEKRESAIKKITHDLKHSICSMHDQEIHDLFYFGLDIKKDFVIIRLVSINKGFNFRIERIDEIQDNQDYQSCVDE